MSDICITVYVLQSFILCFHLLFIFELCRQLKCFLHIIIKRYYVGCQALVPVCRSRRRPTYPETRNQAVISSHHHHRRRRRHRHGHHHHHRLYVVIAEDMWVAVGCLCKMYLASPALERKAHLQCWQVQRWVTPEGWTWRVFLLRW